MPEFSLQGYEDLEVTVHRMRKELLWLLNCLDSLNVKEINTNITRVRSKDGITVINGPQIEMKDTNRLRLKMGYDEATGEFVFTLMDVDGNPTLSMNSLGQLLLGGKPLIEMYDNNNVLRLRMGYNGTTFVYQMFDGNGNETIGLNSNGEAVFKGNVQTAKDARIGNNIEIGDKAQSNVEKRIVFFSNGAEQCAVEMDSSGRMKLEGYTGMDITSYFGDIVVNSLAALILSGYDKFSMETVNNASSEDASVLHNGSGTFYLGHWGSGHVRPQGAWDCGSADFSNLKDGFDYYVKMSLANEQFASKTHTHSNDYVKTTSGQNLSLQLFGGNLEVLQDGVVIGVIPL